MKITMTVSFAQELSQAAQEAAARQGKSLDDWLAAAVEAKLRADEDAAILEKARMAALQEYLDEYWAEFGPPTEEEMAAAARRRLEAETYGVSTGEDENA